MPLFGLWIVRGDAARRGRSGVSRLADPRRRYTKSFARYVLELSRLVTIKDVACHLGVSWDSALRNTVKEIQKLKHLRQIAIDEISVGKGHRYVTLVLNRFHVMKLYNEKLSGLRRSLYREAVDGLQKDVLKGTRWLLLKNPENLNDEKDERKRLNSI